MLRARSQASCREGSRGIGHAAWQQWQESQSERSPSHSTASATTCVASCRTGVGGQAKNRSIFSPARLLDVARRRRRAPDRRTPAAPGCERVARQLLPPWLARVVRRAARDAHAAWRGAHRAPRTQREGLAHQRRRRLPAAVARGEQRECSGASRGGPTRLQFAGRRERARPAAVRHAR